MNQAGPARRAAGLTLAEVLIAMGVLAVGLLGVAAVFPVGGFYLQSGDIADRAGAIAQAALADAVVRGHLDPENWVVHDINNLVILSSGDGSTISRPSGAIFPKRRFMRLLSGESPLLSGLARRVGIRDSLRMSYSPLPGADANTSADPNSYRRTAFGDAYVIDPIGLAGAINNGGTSFNAVGDVNGFQSAPARNFPAFGGRETFSSDAWIPWQDPNITANAGTWPVRRLTTSVTHSVQQLNGPSSIPLQEPVANALFTASDDLAQFLPDAGDEPGRQRWETWQTGGTTASSLRQSRGDYSWIISVNPPSSEARDALATPAGAYPMEVSVVVFHKRTRARGNLATTEAERLVRARVLSVSPGAAEVLLERRSGPEPAESPFQNLRTGEYVMVVGPNPPVFNKRDPVPSRPQLAVRWCRVLSVEDEGTPTLADGSRPELRAQDGSDPTAEPARVLVSLRGPDWPWRPATNTTSGAFDFADPTLASNDLRVAILPGAVAVHTKTMRLESGSEWSAD